MHFEQQLHSSWKIDLIDMPDSCSGTIVYGLCS